MKNNINKDQEFENAGANESGSGAFEAFRSGAVPLPATKICEDPTCKRKFFPKNKRQKYCSQKCADRMHDYKRKILMYLDKPCENCGKDHDHRYGSGRFCSKECKIAYIGKMNDKDHRSAETALKVKKHLDSNRAKGLCGNPKAPYGTWKCEECQIVFGTRAELFQHQRELHAKITINKSSDKYECPFCYKEFNSKKKVIGHLRACKKHPNKELHDLAYKQGGQTYAKRLKEGLVRPSFKGRKHSEASKRKMRISAVKYLQQINATPCRYNKSSISILENIAKEHGWNIQHAENGGEFYTGIGYFVDAYDKEKNIVLEFDEAAHYVDAQNNVLREKDLIRQKSIIEHLHCEYSRYNSVTNTLWKV